MKKIISMFLVLMLLGGSAIAAFVNMTKSGTNWVWRVETEDTNNVLLSEAGGGLLTEAGVRLKVQLGGYFALYHQLKGQGWVETSSAATIPQILEGTGRAISYDFALIEDGEFFITEASQYINL